LPLAMSSSIWLAWIEAALRLGIESGRPMYNQNRFPCHDQTKRSRSLKILTLHSLKRYRSFIPLFVWVWQILPPAYWEWVRNDLSS
jgi:hypothetical protein